MGVAYVKINQISGLKINKNARYEVSATLSSDNSIITPVLFEIRNDNSLFSENVWMLPYEMTAKGDNVSISLVKGKKKYKKIANLVLPLKWFPPDFVVQESFPMHQIDENEKKKRKIFADIKIHLSTKGADPFRAPPGQLLVRPMWVNSNAQQQQPPVGYIPSQCRPPQFFHPQYNQNGFSNQPIRHTIQPPIGIPKITAGPAPQIFSQQTAPQPLFYQGFVNQNQQPQQNQIQIQQNQIQSNQIQQDLNHPFFQQQQIQLNHLQKNQNQKKVDDKETSSDDDGLENLGENNNQRMNPKKNEYTMINSDVDLRPGDFVQFAPITNTNNQNHNQNST